MIRKTVEGREYESQMIGELNFDQTPKEGSFNPVTSDGIFKALGGCSSVEEKLKVIAAALNDLNARLAALESVAADSNIGSVIADSIDTQVLKVGGVDINTIIQNAIGD
jgi:hypothetical protein